MFRSVAQDVLPCNVTWYSSVRISGHEFASVLFIANYWLGQSLLFDDDLTAIEFPEQEICCIFYLKLTVSYISFY